MQDKQNKDGTIRVYTDGSCNGNPGAGGWGVVIRRKRMPMITFSGKAPDTTNQRMEIVACIEALRRTKAGYTVRLYSDSDYIVRCMNDRWYDRWIENGWRNSNNKLVANRDLWEDLLMQVERHDVVFCKVIGHNGDRHNNIADRLARNAWKEE